VNFDSKVVNRDDRLNVDGRYLKRRKDVPKLIFTALRCLLAAFVIVDVGLHMFGSFVLHEDGSLVHVVLGSCYLFLMTARFLQRALSESFDESEGDDKTAEVENPMTQKTDDNETEIELDIELLRAESDKSIILMSRYLGKRHDQLFCQVGFGAEEHFICDESGLVLYFHHTYRRWVLSPQPEGPFSIQKQQDSAMAIASKFIVIPEHME
jgi:hypothetical protein